MAATNHAETALKPSTGYNVAAYDPDDDPYALPECKKAPAIAEEETHQSVPPTEIEAKLAERSLLGSILEVPGDLDKVFPPSGIDEGRRPPHLPVPLGAVYWTSVLGVQCFHHRPGL